MPSREEIMAWYNGLQKSLNDAGIKIDLNNPVDRMRLTIFSYKEDPTGTSLQDTLDEKEELAFIRQSKNEKPVDLVNDNADDILKKIVTDEPPFEMIQKMYEAGQKGTLFVRSYLKDNALPRQIVVGENGQPEVLRDINENSPEEAEMDELLASIRLPGPVPKGPGLLAWIGSILGIKSSVDKVNKYRQDVQAHNEKTRVYQEKMAESKKFGETKVKHYLAGIRASRNYFNTFGDVAEDVIKIQGKLELARRNNIVCQKDKDLIELYDSFKTRADMADIIENSFENLKDLEPKKLVNNPEFEDKLAFKIVNEMLFDKLEKNINYIVDSGALESMKKLLVEEQLTLANKIQDPDSPELKERANELKQTKEFKELLKDITGTKVKDIYLGRDSFTKDFVKLSKLNAQQKVAETKVVEAPNLNKGQENLNKVQENLNKDIENPIIDTTILQAL